MPSKVTTDQQKYALALAQCARTHGPELAEAFTRRLAESAPAKTKIPSVLGFVSLLASAVEHANKKSVGSELALAQERGDDEEPKGRIDSLRKDLYGRVVRARGVLESAAGPRTVKRLGLTGSTPQDPVALVHLVRGVAKALDEKPVKFEQDGVSFDGAKAMKPLLALAGQLEEALGDNAREAREEEASIVLRNRDRADERIDTVSVAAMLRAMFQFARLQELGDRVLPAQARSGAAEGEEEEGEDEEGKAEDDKEPAEPRAKGEEGKSAGKDGGEKSDKK